VSRPRTAARVCPRPAASSTSVPSPPRTEWTRRIRHPVLIGHAASLVPWGYLNHYWILSVCLSILRGAGGAGGADTSQTGDSGLRGELHAAHLCDARGRGRSAGVDNDTPRCGERGNIPPLASWAHGT
jgi:hypothetical protein